MIKWIIITLSITLLLNILRWRLINFCEKKRDRCNLYTATGQAHIIYYNMIINALRFQFLFKR